MDLPSFATQLLGSSVSKSYYALRSARDPVWHEKIKARSRAQRLDPKCKNALNASKKRWRLRNLDKIAVARRAWRACNKETINKRAALRRNKEGRSITISMLFSNTPQQARVLSRIAEKLRAKLNPEKIRAARARHELRVKNDPIRRMKRNIRLRMRKAFKRGGKLASRRLLGTDIDTVRHYLEARFKAGMSWENYGQWHVDHIIPLARAITNEELIARCHFTNLQPLWARENISKGAR